MSKKKRKKPGLVTMASKAYPAHLSADRDETSNPSDNAVEHLVVTDPKDVHPRTAIVEAAEKDLISLLLEHSERHDLTPTERIRVLSFVLGERIRHETKRAIRIERHGSTSKPGDRR